MKKFTKVLAAIMLITALFSVIGCKTSSKLSQSHAYVDLGLPSGTLWATCNVGADKPEENGEYFAWGETQTKRKYSWATYQYCKGEDQLLTKYCAKAKEGYDGFTDELFALQSEDDAATVKWGNGWRIPTKEDWQELFDNTDYQWVTYHGVEGKKFVGSNGKSIFLPAAESRWYSEQLKMNEKEHKETLFNPTPEGCYWSSSLSRWSNNCAESCIFNPYSTGTTSSYRRSGFSVRPVRSAK